MSAKLKVGDRVIRIYEGTQTYGFTGTIVSIDLYDYEVSVDSKFDVPSTFLSERGHVYWKFDSVRVLTPLEEAML
jgi:hypothetical protein